MASAGPNAPGTMATVANGTSVDWATPNNAKVSDNSYATCSGWITTRYSYFLNATDFGFTIPSGATINGVSVSIERKSDNNSAFKFAIDYQVKLIKGGVVSGDNKADTVNKWPTSDGVASYGGAADLWGIALLDSDINASNFGVSLVAWVKYPSGKGNFNTGYVDFISITVTYTEGGGGASAVPTIMNQYRQRRA